MANQSQLTLIEGKVELLKKVFDGEGNDNAVFGYLAIGYDSTMNGFEDPEITQGTSKVDNNFGNFKEISQASYKRIPLSYSSTEINQTTGKVTVYFEADLDYGNIANTQNINQLAIVNTQTIGYTNTTYYSMTSFPLFNKYQETAITFLIGFTL